MFDPSANDMIPLPNSPTVSSISSSSDHDNESTGSSFFQDGSTSLGSLMGLNFPTITFQTPSHSRPHVTTATTIRPSITGEKRRKRWWSLCRNNDTKPGSSLGKFVKVDRWFYRLEAELEDPRSSDLERRISLSDSRAFRANPSRSRRDTFPDSHLLQLNMTRQ